jgi:hypothetical protein
MTALYPNYDMSLSSSQTMSHHHHHHHHASSMQQSNRSASLIAAHQQQQQQSQQSPQTQQQQQQPPQKDYSIPLHVDCSVEYELPNQAKPPVGGRVEPLLMIHPCYFRKMESQRRSPFINNMPNSNASTSRSSNSVSTTAAVASTSSSRRTNLIAASNSSTAHLMTNPNVTQSNHIQSHGVHHQQQQQNLQQQLDEYVQRQMAHISQQAQFPSIAQQQQQQQSNSQYSMPTQHQVPPPMQAAGSGNWDRYMNNIPNASMLGKVNIPNQNAYKKSGKRHLSATCANSYSTSHIEGALPNGITRWDEKTAIMATIPRDYQQSGPESSSTMHAKASTASTATIATTQRNGGNNNSNSSMYCGQQQGAAGVHMSSTKRDRDPMLSGGCIYSNSNNSNSNLTTDINSLASTGLWPTQKSPMAAIPNNNYHQAGPDSIPNNNHSSNSNKTTISNSNKVATIQRQPSAGNTVIHHSHFAQQPHQTIHQSDKQLINSVNSNNNSSNNSNNIITVKCRQYRNSHRMHPYMMNMTGPSVNTTLAGVSYFPQLNGPFSQIQQVSCYNV